MKRAILAVLIMATIFTSKAFSQMVAEQITKDNASTRLFSGTDANGGIGDWYISNGVVQAVIDNAAFAPDLGAKGIVRPLQNGVAPTGGNLIDLGLVGKNNDQFNQMFQIANLDVNNAFFYISTKGAVVNGVATITSEGLLIFGNISDTSNPTLLVQTVYSLVPQTNFITVSTTVINTNKTPVPVFNITDANILVGRGSLPFVPFPGRGFNNPSIVDSKGGVSAASIAAALGIFPFVALPGNVRPQDGIMDTVNNTVCDEVTYGIVPVSLVLDPDGPGPMPPSVSQLPVLLGVGNDLVVGTGNAFDPAKSPMIPGGGTLTFTRRILVGATNDVASVSNFIYSAIFPPAALGTITGDIDADDSADVEANLIFEGKLTPFFQDQIVPMTQVHTDKTGKFSVVLPAGEYNVSVFSPERNDLTNVKVIVTPGTSTAVIPKMSATGQVSFTVTEKGNPVPSKVTFKGVDGTPDPDFSRYFTASIIDPKTAAKLVDLQASTYTSGPALNFYFTGDGTGKQILKPGKYRVYASRGIEYTVAIKDFSVVAGQEIRLDFQLDRVVDTTGFVSADFHIHSGRSFDASATMEDRVKSYVAENVEVLVATDHNFINDYGPIVQKLGLGKFAKTIVGDEITTSLPNPAFPNSFGHHIIFPLKVDTFAPRRGAPATEYVPAATFYDRALLNNPGVQKVIQLNHPRAGVSGLTLIGLFNIINFNPTRPVPPTLLLGSQLGTTTRNIDFNSMELLNGESIGSFQQVRNDWFSLINQGFFKTGTAVADSHRVVVESPGFPRSFVASPTDDPSAVTDDMITTAVRAGKVVGSSGPFIRFDIDGNPLGSLIKKPKGKVKLNITVTAPAWVPVEEVRILANGKQIMAFDATTNPKVAAAPADPTSNQGVERFKATIKIKPKGDTYYTVEAGTKLPNAVDTNNDGVIDTGDTNRDGKIDANDKGLVQPPVPPIYAVIAPGFVPIAFTNPIFIDRNGNGKFDPPGLSATSIPTADFVREEPIEFHLEQDYFPWAKFHVGKEVMQEFMQVLPVDQLKLVEPSQENEINKRIDDRKFDLFNPNSNFLWAILGLRASF